MKQPRYTDVNKYATVTTPAEPDETEARMVAAMERIADGVKGIVAVLWLLFLLGVGFMLVYLIRGQG